MLPPGLAVAGWLMASTVFDRLSELAGPVSGDERLSAKGIIDARFLAFSDPDRMDEASLFCRLRKAPGEPSVRFV